MGRRRSPENKRLPLGVQLRKQRYYYCTPQNAHMRAVFEAKFPGRKSIALGSDETEMRKKWVELFDQTDRDAPAAGTVNEIIERYEREVLPELPQSTRATEQIWIVTLRKEFGHLRYAKSEYDAVRGDYLRTMHVQAHLTRHAKTRPVAANREISTLRKMFRKAKGWGYTEFNPCAQVERNRESPRDTYIDDAVLLKIYDAAHPVLQCMIDIAQMCGCRPGEARRLSTGDVRDLGLLLTPLKGKRGQPQKPRLYMWTPELKAVIERALDLRAQTIKRTGKASSGLFLTPYPHGTYYTKDAICNVWERTVIRAGYDPHMYHFNDIRAKTASDMIDEGQDASRQLGHTDARTTHKVYSRKPVRVAPVIPISSARKKK